MSLLDMTEAETEKYLADRSIETKAEFLGRALLAAGRLKELEALYLSAYSPDELEELTETAGLCAGHKYSIDVRMAAYREGRA